MGLGTLFFGYFLILNIAYFGFTDLIAGLVMLLGLYQLMNIEKNFKFAFYSVIPFSLLGLFELVLEVIEMFSSIKNVESIMTVIGAMRYLLIGVFTYFILSGIASLAKEVDIPKLYRKSKSTIVYSSFIFISMVILQSPFPDSMLKPVAVIAVLMLAASFIVTVVALTVIYSAYANICMPGDENRTSEAPSKFGFVNKFREYEDGKRREYAEYKLSKLNQKIEKQKKGKKKK